MFLMSGQALRYIHGTQAGEIGVGPTVVIVNQGVAKNLSTSTLKDDAYAFIFDQQGLMVELSLEGTKIFPHQALNEKWRNSMPVNSLIVWLVVERSPDCWPALSSKAGASACLGTSLSASLGHLSAVGCCPGWAFIQASALSVRSPAPQ